MQREARAAAKAGQAVGLNERADAVHDEQRGPEFKGANVSTFSYTIDPGDAAAIAGAVLTIAEHHPGHTIWAEGTTVFD